MIPVLVILGLIALFVVYMPDNFVLSPQVYVAVDLVMSWVLWFHSGDLFPLWFAITVDALIVAMTISWILHALRLIAQYLDAIPLIS